MTSHDAIRELLDATADPPAVPEGIGASGGTPAATVAPSAPPTVETNADWLVQLAAAVACRLGQRLAADRVELAALSAEGLQTVARHDERAAATDRSPRPLPGSAGDPSASLAAHALSAGKTVLSPDLSAETRFTDAGLIQQSIVSAVASPVWLDDQAWGVIVAGTRQGGSLGDDAVAAVHRTAEALGALVSVLGAPDPRSLAASASSAAERAARGEQRSSRRRTYRYRQRIGPIVEGKLPDPADFFEVECRDLSQGGVSLVLDAPPEFDEFVIALGSDVQRAHVRARVVNIRAVGRGAYEGFVIGCRFVERLDI